MINETSVSKIIYCPPNVKDVLPNYHLASSATRDVMTDLRKLSDGNLAKYLLQPEVRKLSVMYLFHIIIVLIYTITYSPIFCYTIILLRSA